MTLREYHEEHGNTLLELDGEKWSTEELLNNEASAQGTPLATEYAEMLSNDIADYDSIEHLG